MKKSGLLAVPIVTTRWGGRPSSRRQSDRVHSEIVRIASYRRSAEIAAWYRAHPLVRQVALGEQEGNQVIHHGGQPQPVRRTIRKPEVGAGSKGLGSSSDPDRPG